ncbi:hypothetical protein BH09PLA1_BH09PLA1_04790 [soil metagenome]
MRRREIIGSRNIRTAQPSRASGELAAATVAVLEPLETRRLLATFTQGSTVPASANVNSIAAGDLNGDGLSDIVFTQSFQAADALFVRFGDGRGGYPTGYEITGGAQKNGVALADINKDGRLDVLAAGQDSNLYVLLGNGDGTFATAQTFVAAPAGSLLVTVATADLNGDGNIDVACGAYGNGVRILNGNGSGGFTTGFTFDQSGPVSLCIADVDFDGQADVLWGARSGNSDPMYAIVGLRTSNPQVAGFSISGVGPRVRYLAATNDAQGNLVFALAASGDTGATNGTITQGIRQAGTGTLNSGTFAATIPYRPAVADFDGDGLLDMAFSFRQGVFSNDPAVLGFLRGTTGSLPFTSPTQAELTVFGTGVDSLVTAHANADGNIDLFAPTFNAQHGFTPFLTNRSSLVVSTLADENDGNSRWNSGTGASLREAIQYASSLGGSQTISFAPFLTGTIQLNSPLTIPDGVGLSLTIADDSPATPVTISGQNQRRVIDMNPFSNLTLRNITVANGFLPSGQFGAGVNVGFGATLTVEGSTFTGHTIASGAAGAGTAISIDSTATATIRNSTFSGNAGEATIFGGGNSLTLEHNTISGNTGRGQSAGASTVNGSATLNNNIIAGNTNGADLFRGAVTLGGSNNVIQNGNTSGLNGTINADPRLAPLASNGGATRTRALLGDSPAINHATTLGVISKDQRGIARPQYGTPDIGAYEFNAPVSESLVVTTAVDENDFTSDPSVGIGTSLREALAYAENHPGTDTITFAPALAGQTIAISRVGGYIAGDTALEVRSTVNIVGLSGDTGVTIARADSAPEMRLFTMLQGAQLSVDSLTFRNFKATPYFGTRYGGLVYNSNGRFDAVRSTFTANSADVGGVVYHEGANAVTTFANSTLTANSANSGSAATAALGVIDMTHTTVSGNSGLAIAAGFATPQVTLRGTVVSGNSGGDVGVTLAGSSASNFISGNALLGALGSHSGPTQTMLPLTGSPLVNAGLAGYTVPDQRGIVRPQGTAADIGAVEARLPSFTPALGVTSLDVLSSQAPINLITQLQPSTPGVFSGPGVSGNQFNPGAAPLGANTISYSTTSEDGIVASATATINVFSNATTTTIEGASSAEYSSNQSVTIRVRSVPGWNGRPLGSLTISVNGSVLYSNMQLVDGGIGMSYAIAPVGRLQVLPAGQTHSITATYNPSAAYTTSSGQLVGGMTILPKTLNVYNMNAFSKTYDGATNAGISGGQLAGIITPDNVGLDMSQAVANFDNKNVGINKPVTVSGLGLFGSAAHNYTLTQPTGLTAGITQRQLSVTGLSVAPKTFDGTNSATLDFTAAQLQNVIASDIGAVNLNTSGYTATFSSPAVGQNKPVTVAGLTLSGSAAGNYSVSQPTGLSGSISEAPSFVVTTASDVTDSFDAQTSLREALAWADQHVGADTVTFDPSLAGQTITLSNGWIDANDTASLRVGSQVTIDGNGATLRVADGAQRRHIFVEGSGNLTVNNLTFTNGNVSDYGGAIWSFGSLTVRNCTFVGNHADNEGGAIQTWGGSPFLRVENSTIVGNSANSKGSALGIGSLDASLDHVTIVDNISPNNNGTIWIWQTAVTMRNSIIARNTNDGAQTWGGTGTGMFSTSSSNNLLGAGDWTGLSNGSNANMLGVSPAALRLGTLAENGGATQTVALLPGSPAINAAVAISGINADQRGVARPQGFASDIGAFERAASQGVITARSYEYETRQGVTFTFDMDASVIFSRSQISLINTTTNQTISAGTLSFDADGTRATLLLTNLLPNGVYTLTTPSAFGAQPLNFFVLAGDADHNGVVNFDDYARIDLGFNQQLQGLSNGDFNYDGVVNFDDYALIDLAFNTQGASK